MIRDRKGQAFVPGFLESAARTGLETAGELPGGGQLFEERRGRWHVRCRVSGGVTGTRESLLRGSGGEVVTFDSEEAAAAECARLKGWARGGAAVFQYWPVPVAREVQTGLWPEERRESDG